MWSASLIWCLKFGLNPIPMISKWMNQVEWIKSCLAYCAVSRAYKESAFCLANQSCIASQDILHDRQRGVGVLLSSGLWFWILSKVFLVVVYNLDFGGVVVWNGFYFYFYIRFAGYIYKSMYIFANGFVLSSHQNKKALSPFFGKLSYDHADTLHPIFYRFFCLNPSKTNLKLPNFKLLEK